MITLLVADEDTCVVIPLMVESPSVWVVERC